MSLVNPGMSPSTKKKRSSSKVSAGKKHFLQTCLRAVIKIVQTFCTCIRFLLWVFALQWACVILTAAGAPLWLLIVAVFLVVPLAKGERLLNIFAIGS